jgi:cytochrome c oxidase assembly protein Cox11
VKNLVDIGIPELSDEQIETLSQIAENVARKYIFSKINQKLVENLNIRIEAEGAKPIYFTIEVDLALLPEAKNIKEKTLSEEGVKVAFEAIETYLRKLK